MVLHNLHSLSTQVTGFFWFFGFVFLVGGKEGSNLAHLNSDCIKEKYKPNFKTMFSFYSNQFKTLYKLYVARGSSPFMKIISTSSSPKKMLTKLKKSQIKHFTKGKYR